MAENQMLHIRIPEDMDTDLDEIVDSSQMFISKAEAVRYAIREMLQRKEALDDE